MIDDRLPTIAIRRRIARTSHHIGSPVGSAVRTIPGRRLGDLQTVQQSPQLLPLRRVDHVIGVEPEGIITRGSRECRVAGCGEIIDPDEIKHPRPNSLAISRVRSFEPVSTTTLWSNRPRTDSKQDGRLPSSSRTIMVSETVALRLGDS